MALYFSFGKYPAPRDYRPQSATLLGLQCLNYIYLHPFKVVLAESFFRLVYQHQLVE